MKLNITSKMATQGAIYGIALIAGVQGFKIGYRAAGKAFPAIAEKVMLARAVTGAFADPDAEDLDEEEEED